LRKSAWFPVKQFRQEKSLQIPEQFLAVTFQRGLNRAKLISGFTFHG
jgi:hypothetical protein